MEINAAGELRKAYRTTVFISLAMMVSLVVYTVLVELINHQNAPFNGYAPIPGDVFPTLRYALLAVATLEFLVIQIVNKVMLKAPAVQNASAAAPFGRLVGASVVTFALCESVAVYGFVLFLIQGNTSNFYLFLMISLLYFTLYFPKYSKWEEWVREGEKGTRR